MRRRNGVTIVNIGPFQLKRGESLEQGWERSEKPVRQMFERLIEDASKSGGKWEDPEFGPNNKDETGRFAFYRSGECQPPLPDPRKCKWVRPEYKYQERHRSVMSSERSNNISETTELSEDSRKVKDTKTINESFSISTASNSIDNFSKERESVNSMDFSGNLGDERFAIERSKSSDFGESLTASSLQSDPSWKRKAGRNIETSVSDDEVNDFFAEPLHNTEFFCDKGELFLDGAESNDCVQGNVGNCWFIGALSVLATRDDLLQSVFWKCTDPRYLTQFYAYGIWVCKFCKNYNWYYVFIDDQLPVFSSTLKPVFGHCRNFHELWVPLLEKAYAKLHRSYGSLTGGFIDTALRELTGKLTERILLDSRIVGYNPENKLATDQQLLWKKMDVWINKWGCMLGCSIVVPPAVNSQSGRHEQDVGETGLMARHAYAVIDVGSLHIKNSGKEEVVHLVRVRNPWGFGEWKGKWSDNSPQFAKHFDAIVKEFGGSVRETPHERKRKSAHGARKLSVRNDRFSSKLGKEVETVVKDSKDGTFFMEFTDWLKYFSVLFVAYDFPGNYRKQRVGVKLSDEVNNGGHILKKSYPMNPYFVLTVKESGREYSGHKGKTNSIEATISVNQHDLRVEEGKEQNRHQVPIGIHVFKYDTWKKLLNCPMKLANAAIAQGPYQLHLSVATHLDLVPGRYILVPSCYDRHSSTQLFISVYSECSDFIAVVKGGSFIFEGNQELEEGEWKNIALEGRASGRRLSRQDEALPGARTHQKMSNEISFEIAKENVLENLATTHQDFQVVYKTFLKVLDNISGSGLDWKHWKSFLSKIGLDENSISKSDFKQLAGKDRIIDKEEFKIVLQKEADFKIILGKGSGQSDFQTPEAEHDNNSIVPVTSNERALWHQVDRLQEQQANMMHILLLYGKLLKCHSGPILSPQELLRNGLQIPKLGLGTSTTTKPTVSHGTSHHFHMENDEFLAVKPWKGQIFPNDNHTENLKLLERSNFFQPDGNIKKPKCLPRLSYVYGFNNNFSNGIKLTNSGKIVYCAAALGVIMSTDSKNFKQAYHSEHDDDVTCIAYCPISDVVATGQLGRETKISVWKAETGKGLKLFVSSRKPGKGFYQSRGMALLSFTSDGKFLIGIGMDDEHTIQVFTAVSNESFRSWSEGKFVASIKGDRSRPLFLSCLQNHSSMFVFGGIETIFFFSPHKSLKESNRRKFKPKRARLPDLHSKKKIVLTSAVGIASEQMQGIALIGTASGEIALYEEENCTEVFDKIHEGPCAVTCIQVWKKSQDNYILSGDSKGIIVLSFLGKERSSNRLYLEKLHKYDLYSEWKGSERVIKSKILSLSIETNAKILIVGTGSAEIFKLRAKIEKNKLKVYTDESQILMQGHFKEEVWGLDVNENMLLSGGDDGTVRIFDYRGKSCRSIVDLGNRCRSVAISGDGSNILCGLGGRFGGKKFRSTKTKQKLSEQHGFKVYAMEDSNAREPKLLTEKKLKKDVSCVGFSPNNETIAVGCHDGRVYLAKTADWKIFRSCADKSSSTVLHVDFAADSKSFRTNDASYELLFYKFSTSSKMKVKQVTRSSNFRNTSFSKATCPLTWETQGIWESGYDGSDINAVSVWRKDPSSQVGLIAAANDFGQVKLFRFPTFKAAEPIILSGHSSHVTNTCFSPDGKYLFSTGGNDRCIFQWKIEKQ